METHMTEEGHLSPEQVKFYDVEGYLVLTHLLDDADMAPAREAMMHKVSLIADELYRDGLVPDKLGDRPFETRLAEWFANLGDKDFLRYGRSWRDRLPGYYNLMSNLKILDAVES